VNTASITIDAGNTLTTLANIETQATGIINGTGTLLFGGGDHTIKGTYSVSTIRFTGSGAKYIYDIGAAVDVQLTGAVTVDAGVTIYNTWGHSPVLQIDGPMTNNGTIANNSNGYLTININGNLINDGSWNIGSTRFIGTGSISGTSAYLGNIRVEITRTVIGSVSMQNVLVIEGASINIGTGQTLTTLSNTETQGSGIISGTGTLQFGGGDHTIKGRYDVASIQLIGSGAKYIPDIGLATDVQMIGAVTLDAGVAIYNTWGHNPVLQIDGMLINNGTIANNSNGSLTIAINGNINNNGSIQISNLTLTPGIAGTYTQSVTIDSTQHCIGDLTLTSQLILNAALTIGSHELTLHQPIAGTPTLLTTDSTSSIVIAGSASGIVLPASISKVLNFTLRNSAGLTLSSNLKIFGTLTLAGGTLNTNGYQISYGEEGILKYEGATTQSTTDAIFPILDGPKNLLIADSGGVLLHAPRTITGLVEIQVGLLNTKNAVLTLGETASVNESGGSIIGDVLTTRTINLNAWESFGNLGLDIYARGQSPGQTQLIRTTDSSLISNSIKSIKRFFKANPTTNENLNAEIQFHYRTEELNTIEEKDLYVYQSSNSAGPWKIRWGAVQDSSNIIALKNINTLAFLTASTRKFGDTLAPLPPQNFTAQPQDRRVILSWNSVQDDDFLQYRIYLDTIPNPTFIADSLSDNRSDTTKTIFGLLNGLTYYARVTVLDSALNESAFSNTISFVPKSITGMTIRPAIISFGKVRLGQSKDTTVMITNTGVDTLRVQAIVSSSSDFSSRLQVLTLPPGESISDSLRFIPQHQGEISAHFTLTSNIEGGSDTIFVSGYGAVYALSFSDTTVDFGNIAIGNIKDTVITITNIGNDTLCISSIAGGNNIFSSVIQAINLAPSESIQDTIRFEPTTVGVFEDILIVASNTPSSPDTIRVKGTGIPKTSIENGQNLPLVFSLSQNYPNPFNPTTMINYDLPKVNMNQKGPSEGYNVSLRIFDLIGREVAVLVNEQKPAGRYSVTWDARNVSSGIYFYKLTAGSYKEVKKMIVIK
jgi:hypothetical protein